jgi:hypothetical protein
MKEIMQNGTISGFPYPRRPGGSEGVEFREPFMRPFAPCFAQPPECARLYLLDKEVLSHAAS